MVTFTNKCLQIHSNKRNKLEQKRLNDFVFVKYNQALKAQYDRCNVIDHISLVDIDESNEWLIGKISEEDTTIHAEDDLVFEDDSLTWGVVASASGVGDANISTRLRPRSKTSLKGDLVAATSQPDFEEKESNLEDIEEDDNEMEGYQSSLDESDDNFNFNDDYNGDA